MKKIKERYKLKYEKIIWGKLSNKYVVVLINENVPYLDDIKKLFYFTTKSSLDILDGLLGKKSTEEIIKSLTKKYNISYKKAKTDFLVFLNQLKRLRLIS